MRKAEVRIVVEEIRQAQRLLESETNPAMKQYLDGRIETLKWVLKATRRLKKPS